MLDDSVWLSALAQAEPRPQGVVGRGHRLDAYGVGEGARASAWAGASTAAGNGLGRHLRTGACQRGLRM